MVDLDLAQLTALAEWLRAHADVISEGISWQGMRNLSSNDFHSEDVGKLRKSADAVLALLHQIPQWLPMNEAPKDKAIIVWFESVGEGFWGVCHWQEYSDGSKGWLGSSFCSVSGNTWTTVNNPLWWMPLPQPPNGAK